MKKILYLLPIFLLTLAFNLEALEIQTGTDFTINGIYDENYYVAGGSVLIENGAVFNEDLFIAGGNIRAFGEANDVMVFGGEVSLENYVKGDLRVFGGTVNINSTVDGDLVIIGGEVYLNDSADIRGESIVIGGKVNQSSDINNESNIVAGSVTLNGIINSVAYITTQSAIFDKKGEVVGNLNYYAPQKAVEIDGFKSSGNIVFNEIKSIDEIGIVKSTVINLLNLWLILKFITTLVIAFILIYVFKVFSQGVNDIGVRSMGKSFLAGVLGLLMIPLIIIMLFASLIGMPISFLLLLLYIIILMISTPIAGIIIGHLAASLSGKDIKRVNFQNSVIGIILITALQFVPVLGAITIFIFRIIAVGAVLRYIRVVLLSKN